MSDYEAIYTLQQTLAHIAKRLTTQGADYQPKGTGSMRNQSQTTSQE